MNWYYVERGQQTGPVSNDQLADMLRTGVITLETLVWHDGMAEWKPLKTVQADISTAPPATPDGVGTATTSPGAQSPSQPVNYNPGQGAEAVCAECGSLFPINEMIRHGNAYICANCKPVFMQKLSEGAPILAPGELRYAGFWIRFAAKFIDGLILGIPMMIILVVIAIPIMGAASHKSGTPAQPVAFAVQGLFQIVILAANLFYQVFFLGKYGATPGKMACKLKVVTSDGEKISYSRALGRYFSELLSGLICDIGYIMVAFDNPQKRALHDHICNTRVVYK